MTDDKTSSSPGAAHDGRAVAPEHVVRNAHAIAEMHLQAERAVGAHQRAIESGTARLGRPASLYVILAVVALWAFVNALGARLGIRAPDPPPFVWLQGVVGLLALLTATMVLITQNRQSKLIEQRMHLDLQVNLLTEQKTAKLIELLEELRRDLPNVRDRHDAEAEVMQRAAEPLEVVAAMEAETLESVREALASDEDEGEVESGPEEPGSEEADPAHG
jgi:uncharacterized membrane protein